MGKLHDHLWTIVHQLPADYEPWGEVSFEDAPGPMCDCSHGCAYAMWLEAVGKQDLGADWCVCTHSKSHRCGLLTFEHQGCRKFARRRGHA